jgi:Uma2 family endonuclease
MTTLERHYTVDDLWVISHTLENDATRYFLLEGELYEMPPTGWLHGDSTHQLDRHVGNHVAANKLGRVTGAETGFILYKNPDPDGKDTVLAPDVAFIAAARVPTELPDGYVPFAPDLAVEVVSPGNAKEEISMKIEAYLRYGTRLVWIVYPKQQKIHVYRPNAATGEASLKFLYLDDTLDGEDVLPGFKLPLRELFGIIE